MPSVPFLSLNANRDTTPTTQNDMASYERLFLDNYSYLGQRWSVVDFSVKCSARLHILTGGSLYNKASE